VGNDDNEATKIFDVLNHPVVSATCTTWETKTVSNKSDTRRSKKEPDSKKLREAVNFLEVLEAGIVDCGEGPLMDFDLSTRY